MQVSGLSILKNAIRFDYPFQESIRSALPLCDEFVVVVGRSEDGTLEAVRTMNEPKLRIVETEWSDKVQPRRHVVAQQTNIGLHMCRGDWVVYLQANEMLHESSLPALEQTMQRYADDRGVEALVLEFLDFWGDYGHVVPVYPHRFKYVPRIVKPYVGTYAIRDAMGVAVFDGFSRKGRYPRAVDTGQDLFRYGNVRNGEVFADKQQNASHLSDGRGNEPLGKNDLYTIIPRSFVAPYQGSHPAVMAGRVARFGESISLEDPRWRLQPTWRERRCLAETWFYRRFGVPQLRRKRYRLIGGYQKKARGSRAG